MRRPPRSPRPASRIGCPGGQVTRSLLASLLGVSLALPAQAAQDPVTAPAAVSPPAVAPGAAPTAEPAPEASSRQAEALRLFRAAKELYSAGQYGEAARAFAESYAAAESAEAAYNAALAHDKVGARLETMMWFRRYLAVARSDTDPSYPLALKRVEDLRARLGELRLQIDAPDEVREVQLNGRVVALGDFPQLVEPGRVEVRLLGHETDEVADIPAEVSPGGTWTIHFTGFARPQEVAPIPRTTTPPIVRPDPRPEPRPSRRGKTLAALFWTSTGLTVASAVTMSVFGGMVLRTRDDPKCTSLCPEDGEAFLRYQRDTNIMIGVTAGLGVVSLALGIAALRERRRSRAQVLSGRLRLSIAGPQLMF